MAHTDFDALFAKVEALMRHWALDEATSLLEAARTSGNFPNRLHHDLSVLYAQQGLFDEALAEIEAAMAGDPLQRAVWHHFLAIQKNNPVQPSASEWRAMHLAYGDTLRDRVDARHRQAKRSREPGRKVRVGYLCPDTHLATARFTWPLLECFDGDRFEVFAYWAHETDPATLATAYPRVVHCPIRGLTDDAVTARVVGDAIDILVDVAGHGAANRLPVLAARPAPICATWLDYLATTGLASVDYRITDAVADPPGAEAAHVEKLERLAVPQWCYRPPQAAQPSPPSRRPGEGVVFGSICVPLKVSEIVVDLWARILQAVPEGRLRILGFPEGRARSRVTGLLVEKGIDTSRIEFRARLAEADFFSELLRLDVVLDSHPFSGATSSFDALWQGVPVVTLAGSLAHSRSTASILTELGETAWIAASPEAYVATAVALARDPSARAAAAARLRPALQQSPLCDGPRFAREMEQAFTRWVEAPPNRERSWHERTEQFWRSLPPGRNDERVNTANAPDWILVTHEGLFAPEQVSVLTDALRETDVLGPLGTDCLVSGEVTAAGQGHVCGVERIADPASGRDYLSAWTPEGFGPCVALTGGALLVRRAWWERHKPAPHEAADESHWRAQLLRLTHVWFRQGARLGVSVSLAVPSRHAIVDASREFAAQRWVEQELGLPRWGQEWPAARPHKGVIASKTWPSMCARLETACAVGVK